MSSPRSADTDHSYSSLPMTSSTSYDRVLPRPGLHSESSSNHAPSEFHGIPAVTDNRRQLADSKTLPSASRYPHKERLFVAIGNHDNVFSTDVSEREDEPRVNGFQRESTSSTNSLKRVKFNVEEPVTGSVPRNGVTQQQPTGNSW